MKLNVSAPAAIAVRIQSVKMLPAVIAKKFKARSNLNRHLKTVHQEDKRNIVSYEFNAFTNKCLECYKSFVKAEQLRYHLMTDHSKAFPEENYQFSCREGDFNCYPVYNLLWVIYIHFLEFDTWFKQICQINNSEYVRQKTRKTDDSKIVYFYCNRSGKFIFNL